MSFKFPVIILGTFLFLFILTTCDGMPLPQSNMSPGIDDLGKTPKGGGKPLKTGTKDPTDPQTKITGIPGKSKDDEILDEDDPSSENPNDNPISNPPSNPETQSPPQIVVSTEVPGGDSKGNGVLGSKENPANGQPDDEDPGMNQPGGSEQSKDGESLGSKPDSGIDTGDGNTGEGGKKTNPVENQGEGQPPEGKNPSNQPTSVDDDNTGKQDNDNLGVDNGGTKEGGKQNEDLEKGTDGSEVQSSTTTVPPTVSTEKSKDEDDNNGGQSSLDDSLNSKGVEGQSNGVNGSSSGVSTGQQSGKEENLPDSSNNEPPTQEMTHTSPSNGEDKSSTKSDTQSSLPENGKGDKGLVNDTTGSEKGDTKVTGSQEGDSDKITTAPEELLTRTVKAYQPTDRVTGPYLQSTMTMVKTSQPIALSEETTAPQDQNVVPATTSVGVEEPTDSLSTAQPTAASQNVEDSSNSSVVGVESTPNLPPLPQTNASTIAPTTEANEMTTAGDHPTTHERPQTSPHVSTGAVPNEVATSQSPPQTETSTAVVTTEPSLVVVPEKTTQASAGEIPDKEEHTTADDGHIRKRPPANPNREEGGTEVPEGNGRGVTNPPKSPETEISTKTSGVKNDTSTGIPHIVEEIMKEYGPLKVSLALLTVLVILLFSIFCCCKLCRRKGYRMRQRRLKEYGQEKEFLLNERNPKSQYHRDTLTLLDGSSEDEF